MSVWDDPNLKSNDDYVKFETVGDTISANVLDVRVHTFDDGKAVPQILVVTDEGDERTITAGQVRLKAALAEQRPEAGDRITITLSDIEKRAGGKTLKHFDVNVARGGTATTPAAAPAAAAGAVDPAAAAAALAALSPEQKAALGISA